MSSAWGAPWHACVSKGMRCAVQFCEVLPTLNTSAACVTLHLLTAHMVLSCVLYGLLVRD